ncbi:aminoglycoside phosphotransferase family protein [Paeniglutamicibacter sp. NPDC012692]|uniref:aminoglycoside phosphotransferase family protein n=1 Tax=Paeniglutamicibacter sp. NPDC012692 TaxID=3364388 RepID=UPI0036B6CCBE
MTTEDPQADRDAGELAALTPAIPRLIELLGGTPVHGAWDFNEHQIRLQHRPGAGISAVYRMPVGTGFAELGVSTEKIHMPSAPSVEVPDPGTGSTVTVTGWIHPNDPMLPGLSTALDGPAVTRLWGQGDLLGGLRTVAYRPLRRAVVRVSFVTRGPVRIERTLYLKVGREHASAALLKRHLLMEGSGVPVPRVARPVVAGILALEEGVGEGLAAAIRRDAGNDLSPGDFTALLDRLPPELMDLPARRAWSDGILRYRQAAVLALPAHHERIDVLVQRIGHHVAHSDRGPLVPVHGDFYDGNILMRGGAISAILDLDSLGPGHRVDDLACFLGHLAVLPSISGKNLPAAAALERFGGVFERTVDPVALWARAGAVALTLVAGARVAGSDAWIPAAEARLRVAEELVDRADRSGQG